MVVDEKARGDRAVPATAQRSRLNSVSLPPKTWQLIDEMRGSSSRGVFISVCVYRKISARLTQTHVATGICGIDFKGQFRAMGAPPADGGLITGVYRVERDRFVAHLYQSRREYRGTCETAGKSGKQIERCVIASFRIAESMALRVRQSEEVDRRLITGGYRVHSRRGGRKTPDRCRQVDRALT